MQLPAELLERVLALLPPQDLVRVRAVCTAWRAVVAALAQRDRAVAFRCGWVDLFHADVPLECLTLLDDVPVLACTCGGLVDATYRYVVAEHVEDTSRDDTAFQEYTASWYRYRHQEPVPPARWVVLARERALAMKMVRLGKQLTTHVHWDLLTNNFYGVYSPYWAYLPDGMPRPTTVPALVALVTHILQEGTTSLASWTASPATARSFYARADAASVHTYKLNEPSLRTAAAEYDKRVDDFYAAYPNGPAIYKAYFTMTVALSRTYPGMEPLMEWDPRYPNEASVLAAYNAMQAAFKAAEARAGRGPNDPLVTDAEWHDAWMRESEMLTPAEEAKPPPDEFVSFADLVNETYGGRNWRRAPFDYGTFQRIQASDPTGWSSLQYRARITAACVRLCVRKGWRRQLAQLADASFADADRPQVDGADVTDAEMLAIAERMVTTADAVKSTFARSCSLSVVVTTMRGSQYRDWIGGLSPGGHLVGILTSTHATPF